MEQTVCPVCGNSPFALFDRKYINTFNRCWDCDKKDWKEGLLSLQDFENREEECELLLKIDIDNNK